MVKDCGMCEQGRRGCDCAERNDAQQRDDVLTALLLGLSVAIAVVVSFLIIVWTR